MSSGDAKGALMNLLPCPKCLRHARASEPACPFCKTPLPADFAARSPKGGMWRWHVVTAGALASSASMADCSSHEVYGAPCVFDAGCPSFSEDAGADDALADGAKDGPADD